MRRLVLVLLSACGPNFSDDIILTDGSVTRFDATTDAPPFDAALDADADATIFNGGGPFVCGDCICDGTSSFCYSPDASADASDAGACGDASACWSFPIACLPKPTCACLQKYWTNASCTCDVDPSGNGIVLVCP